VVRFKKTDDDDDEEEEEEDEWEGEVGEEAEERRAVIGRRPERWAESGNGSDQLSADMAAPPTVAAASRLLASRRPPRALDPHPLPSAASAASAQHRTAPLPHSTASAQHRTAPQPRVCGTRRSFRHGWRRRALVMFQPTHPHSGLVSAAELALAVAAAAAAAAASSSNAPIPPPQSHPQHPQPHPQLHPQHPHSHLHHPALSVPMDLHLPQGYPFYAHR